MRYNHKKGPLDSIILYVQLIVCLLGMSNRDRVLLPSLLQPAYSIQSDLMIFMLYKFWPQVYYQYMSLKENPPEKKIGSLPCVEINGEGNNAGLGII